MIFISGVHGVGKSYFCNKVKAELGIDTFSASRLIAERKHTRFSSDKLIPDIDANQQYLLMAIQELDVSNPNYLLDGHFCLLNAKGQVTRISSETFTALRPKAIVLLTEKLYYGFFGAGNNVNWVWLKNNGYWPDGYPTTARLTPEQFKAILREGNVDVPNVIIN